MLLSKHYASRYPETYADTLSPENIYHGDFQLSDKLSGSGQTVGEALLSPTRTYLPIMHRVYAEFRSGIHGAIHSSGGGQVKCKHFGTSLHYIKDNLFPPPPIFGALAATGGLTPREMYQVFNMGQRMEIYCPPTVAESVIAISEDFGVEARVIGCVVAAAGDRNTVSIISGDDTHHY
jgi:phosphoribosylformylglycinamidine cyclo-ligase